MKSEAPDNETTLKMIEEYLRGQNGRRLARELADMLGVSEVTLSRWRNGRKPVGAAYRRQVQFLCRSAPTAMAVNGAAAANGGVAVSVGAEPRQADRRLAEAMDRVMASDMCDACKIKAYGILSDIAKGL